MNTGNERALNMRRCVRQAAAWMTVLVFLPSSAPSSASAQGVQQPFGLTVFDANGKKVGNATAGGPGGAGVAFQIQSPSLAVPQLVVLMVGQTGFFGGGGGQLVFTSSTCTGTTYFMSPTGTPTFFLGTQVQVVGANQTVYIPDPNSTTTTAAPATTLYMTTFGPPPATPMCTSFTPAGSFQFVQALALIDLTGANGLFTPPFSLRAVDSVLLGY